MTDLGRIRALHLCATDKPADLLECAGDPQRIPRELHSRSIREELTLSTHGGLDHAAKEHPEEADSDQPRAKTQGAHGHHRQRGVLLAAPSANTGVRHHPKDELSDQRDDHDPVQEDDEPEIETHIPIEDVAELMRHNAL